MLNQLKKNKSIKYFFSLLIFSFLIDFSIAKDKKFAFYLTKNPTNLDYWWLGKNNYGQSVDKINFQTSIKFKNSKTTYAINLFSKDKNNIINDIYLNETFIKYNFDQNTFLRVGRYYKDFSTYLNDNLSSGSLLISYNAQAMPKIGLVSSQKYSKASKIHFDFGIAHGVFQKNNLYTKAPYLHEKFIYLNVVNNNKQFSIGLVHEAMWGGSTSRLGDQPDSFKDFLKVFISADGDLMEGEPHANAVGNHLGIWDFFYQRVTNNQILKLYYQHLFEDTSGLRFANKTDGLWGLELINYIPQTTLLVEYINTKNQTINPPYVQEGYYNHGVYDLGWTYKNYTLGSPFIQNTDSSNIVDTEVVYIAANTIFSSKYHSNIKMSKKTNTGEKLNYKFQLTRVWDSKCDVSFFVINSDNNIGFGFTLNRYL